MRIHPSPPEALVDAEGRKARSRTEYVYLNIRDAIRARRFEPGQRIREAEIAKWLGVSRTPVREAINRLTTERLLVETQFRGVTVAELEQRQVRELYALRERLEGMAAGLAAEHASPDEIEAMRDNIAETSRHYGDPYMQYALNERLHSMIREAANNRYLSEALDKLGDALDLLQGTTFDVEGRPEAAQREHARIVDAVGAGDAEKAEEAAREHMRNACRVRIRQIFGPKLWAEYGGQSAGSNNCRGQFRRGGNPTRRGIRKRAVG